MFLQSQSKFNPLQESNLPIKNLRHTKLSQKTDTQLWENLENETNRLLFFAFLSAFCSESKHRLVMSRKKKDRSDNLASFAKRKGFVAKNSSKFSTHHWHLACLIVLSERR
jgi:hypothetical protein